MPANGVLSFWVYQGSNEGQLGFGTRYAWQAGYLLNTSGTILKTFYKTVNNTNGWVNYQVNLSAYAGQTDYIYFGCYGDGYYQSYVYQYVDNVAWVGASPPLAVSDADGEADGDADELAHTDTDELTDADTDELTHS